MPEQMSRVEFNAKPAAALAQTAVGHQARWEGNGSARFAYFADDERFVVVAGPQEEAHVEKALAYGMTYRQDRRLVLILPKERSLATLQRAPWFKPDTRPEIWLHDKAGVTPQTLPDRDETVQALVDRLEEGQTPAAELTAATVPVHLGAGTAAVRDLVEWATRRQDLDPAHRRGERAWHCMGQKVLTLTRTTGGLRVTAGVHYSGDLAPEPAVVMSEASLDAEAIASITDQVEAGIAARLNGGPPIHRPDEHWLQAVIRRRPELVGVEQPALRELPAWRPRDDPKRWGRGYIDLLGLDGHGEIRIVETKMSDNQDELLVLQGLDYYVWARAYLAGLTARLGISAQTPHDHLEIHYVLGATTKGEDHHSQFTKALATNLDDEIRWRFQTVHNWFHGPDDIAKATAKMLRPRVVPAAP